MSFITSTPSLTFVNGAHASAWSSGHNKLDNSLESSGAEEEGGDLEQAFSETLQRQFEEFQKEKNSFREATENMGFRFSVVFVTFGTVAVFLNILVFTILILYRHRVLKQVFYLLVMNFAIIDILKGTCLILWSVRILKPQEKDKIYRIISMKIDQSALVVLRTCNLATIFNLFLITFNEFLYIKYPLRYHRLVSRCRVICLVVLCWLLSCAFTLAGTFARNFAGSVHTVYVANNATIDDNNERNRDRVMKTNSELQPQYIFSFTLLGFCLFCLITVIVCYTTFFCIIRRIQQYDEQLREETRRKPSTVSLNSTEAAANGGTPAAAAPPEDQKKIKRQLLKRNKYVLVIGLVIAVYMLYLLSYGTIQVFQFLRLSQASGSHHDEPPRTDLLIRWTLQVLVGIHAVLQPICYFRMHEFRFLVRKTFDRIRGRRMSQTYLTNSVMVTDYQPNGHYSHHAGNNNADCRKGSKLPSEENYSSKPPTQQQHNGHGVIPCLNHTGKTYSSEDEGALPQQEQLMLLPLNHCNGVQKSAE